MSATLKDAGLDADAAAFTVNLAADARMTPADARVMAALHGARVPSRPAGAGAAGRRARSRSRWCGDGPRPAGGLRIAGGRAAPRPAQRGGPPRRGGGGAGPRRRPRRGDDARQRPRHLPNDPRLSVMDARVARAAGDARWAQASLQVAAEQRRSQIGLDRGATLAAADRDIAARRWPGTGRARPSRRSALSRPAPRARRPAASSPPTRC